MDNIEITVFDEIKDYKEKIYFFNFRQWIFAILIIIAVVPTYLILKEKIGEEATDKTKNVEETKTAEEKAEEFILQHHSSYVSLYLLDKYFVQKESPDFTKIKSWLM